MINMMKKTGRQTLRLQDTPSIVSFASVVGQKEGEGPIGHCFDKICLDAYFGEKSWEKAESSMLKECFELCCDKLGIPPAELDMIGSWEDYWYPAYLPDGYQITYAEEAPAKCLLIQPGTGAESLIITEYSQGTEISYDTEHSQISDIQILNYLGKRIAFENHTIIAYPTETMILEFRFDAGIPEQEVVKIAENMEYIAGS